MCKKCSVAADNDPQNAGKSGARLLFEGEAESINPRFSVNAMAKWSDPERRILVCPICKIVEKVGD